MQKLPSRNLLRLQTQTYQLNMLIHRLCTFVVKMSQRLFYCWQLQIKPPEQVSKQKQKVELKLVEEQGTRMKKK